MKVISLQKKIRHFLWLLTATFLMGLFILSIHVRMMDCKDWLLVTPITSDSSRINTEALEKTNGGVFLLTYEILSKENLQALNANYDVAVIKTNFTYPFIMHKKLLEGSFFTEKDQKERKNLAVLNKTSAYAMFGNINVSGLKIKMGQNQYTVTGVIDDESEDKSIYIPVSCSEENPRSFVVGLENNLTREQIKNQCKSILSEESGYRFIYFGDLAEVVYGVFLIGLKLAAISIFLFFIQRSNCRLQQNIKEYKDLLKRHYARELFEFYPKKVIKIGFAFTCMITMIILILNLIFSSIEYFLFCHDNIWVLQLNDSSAFGFITSALKTSIYLSVFFIIGFSINICLLLMERLHSSGDWNNGKNTN